VAQLFTLYTTPVVYVLMDKLRRKRSPLVASRDPGCLIRKVAVRS